MDALKEAAGTMDAASESGQAPLFSLPRLDVLGMGLCPLKGDDGGGIIVLAAAVAGNSGLRVSSMAIATPEGNDGGGDTVGELEVSEAAAPLLAGAAASTVRVLAENVEAAWAAPVAGASVGAAVPLVAPEGGSLSAEPDFGSGAVLVAASSGGAAPGSGEAAVLLVRAEAWPEAARAQQQALHFTGGVVALVASGEEAAAVLRASGATAVANSTPFGIDGGEADEAPLLDGTGEPADDAALHGVRLCVVSGDGGVMGLEEADAGARPQAWDAAADEAVDGSSLIALTGQTLQLAASLGPVEGAITGVRLVSGDTEAQAAAACPEGFAPVLAGACGGNLAAAAAMCASPLDQPAAAAPAVVLLCASRAGDGDGALLDAGLLVRSSDSEFEASPPPGYASQTIDIRVLVDSAGPTEDAASEQADGGGAEAAGGAAESKTSGPGAVSGPGAASGAAESKTSGPGAAGGPGASIGISITLIWTADAEAVRSTRASAAQAAGRGGGPLGLAPGDAAAGRAAGSGSEGSAGGLGIAPGAGDEAEADLFGVADHEQEQMEAEAAAEATAALHAERADLAARLREAEAEREALEEDNRLLHRHALLFFLDKGDGAGRAGAMAGASSADKEERYEELLSELRAAQEQLALAEESFAVKGGRLNAQFKEQSARLEAVRERLAAFQREVCDKACDAVTGTRLPRATARAWASEAAMLREVLSGARQEQEVDRLRLAALQRSMKAKEEVGEGLSAIDFEQLKIENATVHEKIEDRQEELRKLRAKMTTTVQVLTHVREKLQFVQAEADALHAKDAAVKAEVASQRAALAGSKRQREKQRALIEKRRTARGFAHSDALAIDFEARKTECVAMRQQLADMRRRYADLNRRAKDSSAMVERVRDEAEALGVGEAVAAALA